MNRTQIDSPYMQFARGWHSHYMLGSSGVMAVAMAELGTCPADLEINGPSGGEGYAPLIERIAHYCGVDPACVVTANGCSMANHLAFAASFEAGDEVLVEHPTYELLLSALQFLGARIKRFLRRPENGYALEPSEIERQLTPQTRLIVLCNLHNPSSAQATDDTLRSVGGLARTVGARVLVDEVYLEAVFPRPQTALRLGSEFIVTSSLTKAYGLSGLRCGWILAEPAVAHRIRCLNDLFGVHQPHPADRLSVFGFGQMETLVARTRQLLASNRKLALDFLHSRDDLECFIPEHGTTLFPRLKRGSVDALASLLETKYDTMIVPGRFFGMPDHFRLGLGIDTEMMREGLERLGAAIDETGKTE